MLRISTLKEEDMEGNHFVAKCNLLNKTNTIETCALVDTGATGYAFANEEFVSQHNIPRYQLRSPRTLEVIDGRTIESGEIREYIKIPMDMGGHKEEVCAFITQLGQYSMVLGIPWMRTHGVNLDFGKEILTFGAHQCQQKCMTHNVTIPNELHQTKTPMSIAAISATAYCRSIRNHKRYGKLQAFSLSLYDVNKALGKETKTNLKETIPEMFHEFLPMFEESLA
jgi:predicted aspartyl protease